MTNGGPAFPNQGIREDSPFAWMSGMSLRDWFAGQALSGLVVAPDTYGENEKLARVAYMMADEMLKVRNSKEIASETGST